MKRSNNIQSQKRRLKEQLLRNCILLAIVALYTILATTCIQYGFYSFKCMNAENYGNETHYVSATQVRNNWDNEEVVQIYKNAIAEKKAFIESNLIAEILSSLNVNWLGKMIQLIVLFTSPIICGFLWALELTTIRSIIKRSLRLCKAMKEQKEQSDSPSSKVIPIFPKETTDGKLPKCSSNR